MPGLTISLDAVASLRDAVGARETDLVAAAKLVELAGAEAVALGLAEEGPGTREENARELRGAARSLELHMAPIQPLLKLALEVRPDRVVLASLEREDDKAAPLDFRAYGASLSPVVRMLVEAGLHVSALVHPDLEAVKAAYQADLHGVDLWTAAVVDLPRRERAQASERLGDAARLAAKLRLEVTLSGGLGPRSLPTVLAAAPVAGRVVVGRGFAARALLLGMDRSVRDLLEQLR
ncbi:MAG: pyridoxine 5'-phosphate synthase [Myxococcota bacterium]